jgi:iron complex transport system permease protein
MGRAMDAATLGDDEARSIGLAIGPLRLSLFFLAGALTSVAVALAGPIGFVGLIAPHAARLVLGPRHAALVVGAALVGVTLLVAGDVVSQIIAVSGGRMPVGVFTALIGGPAFIWLLRSGKGQV